MASGVIGTLRDEKRDEILDVEWQIDDFFSLPHIFYNSPYFRFSDSFWCLKIFPCDTHLGEDWISLYLTRKEHLSSESIAYKFGIREWDGSWSLKGNITWKFDENHGYGERFFYGRSELLQRIGGCLPSVSLTIVCRLKKPAPPRELNRICAGLKHIPAPEKFSDVTLHVGQYVFDAHKIILAASSTVLDSMLGPEVLALSINWDSVSFKNLMQFLYTGRADITECNVRQIYRTAHSYKVEELLSHCTAFMIDNLTFDNVCDVAALGDERSDLHLTNYCTLFFKQNLENIFATSRWKSFWKENRRVAEKLLKGEVSNIVLN